MTDFPRHIPEHEGRLLADRDKIKKKCNAVR